MEQDLALGTFCTAEFGFSDLLHNKTGILYHYDLRVVPCPWDHRRDAIFWWVPGPAAGRRWGQLFPVKSTCFFPKDLAYLDIFCYWFDTQVLQSPGFMAHMMVYSYCIDLRENTRRPEITYKSRNWPCNSKLEEGEQEINLHDVLSLSTIQMAHPGRVSSRSFPTKMWFNHIRIR